jgi:hypothetical protein
MRRSASHSRSIANPGGNSRAGPVGVPDRNKGSDAREKEDEVNLFTEE